MEEGKFVAEFLAANVEKIWSIGTQAYGKLDEKVKIALKTAYTNYIKNAQDKFLKSKSFFIRDQPVDLYTYYVPISIGCGKNLLKKPTFNDLIKSSLRVVITGSGGSGKSVLMKHLFLDCIKDKKYTPVLVELRDLNADNRSLEELIEQTLDNLGFKTTGDFIKRAKEAGHLSFLMVTTK